MLMGKIFSIGYQQKTCSTLRLLPTGYQQKIYNCMMSGLLLLEGGYPM
jgi:hypothetical protein